uniref:CCHC-type domain-containing protein n=1 Tax=Paramormyrops kingsleyae TaxID=1676925 RepID=A0A3B3Q742_9TELE
MKQFIRGCWEDQLLAALRLKENCDNPFQGPPSFSELLYRIRAYEEEVRLKEMRKRRHLGNGLVRAHVKTQAAIKSEVVNSDLADTENSFKERLEAKIQYLEAELRRATAGVEHRNEKKREVGLKPTRVIGTTPVRAAIETIKSRPRRFCYNCGEDSHILPNCSNSTNAELVQVRLCERHQGTQDQANLVSKPPLNY